GSSHRDNHLFRGDDRADLFHHIDDDRGLYANENDIRLAGGLQVVGPHLDVELLGHRASALGVRHGSGGGCRRNQAFLEQRLQQNAAHLSGAQDGHAFARYTAPHCRVLSSIKPIAANRPHDYEVLLILSAASDGPHRKLKFHLTGNFVEPYLQSPSRSGSTPWPPGTAR